MNGLILIPALAILFCAIFATMRLWESRREIKELRQLASTAIDLARETMELAAVYERSLPFGPDTVARMLAHLEE